jgi:hypothetical protein
MLLQPTVHSAALSPSHSQAPKPRAMQAVVLKQLCAYFDVDAPLYQPSRRWSLLDPAEWDELFLPAKQGGREHQYLLCPVDGDMRYVRSAHAKPAEAGKVRGGVGLVAGWRLGWWCWRWPVLGSGRLCGPSPSASACSAPSMASSWERGRDLPLPRPASCAVAGQCCRRQQLSHLGLPAHVRTAARAAGWRGAPGAGAARVQLQRALCAAAVPEHAQDAGDLRHVPGVAALQAGAPLLQAPRWCAHGPGCPACPPAAPLAPQQPCLLPGLNTCRAPEVSWGALGGRSALTTACYQGRPVLPYREAGGIVWQGDCGEAPLPLAAAEGARVWWRYAFKSVRRQLTSHHVNWADLKRAAGLRKAYIPQYLRCLQEGKVGRCRPCPRCRPCCPGPGPGPWHSTSARAVALGMTGHSAAEAPGFMQAQRHASTRAIGACAQPAEQPALPWLSPSRWVATRPSPRWTPSWTRGLSRCSGGRVHWGVVAVVVVAPGE